MSLGSLPRTMPPVLASPEHEQFKGKDDNFDSVKKTLPSTKTSFEHFKRQALEKSERVCQVLGFSRGWYYVCLS